MITLIGNNNQTPVLTFEIEVMEDNSIEVFVKQKGIRMLNSLLKMRMVPNTNPPQMEFAAGPPDMMGQMMDMFNLTGMVNQGIFSFIKANTKEDDLVEQVPPPVN
ncbi:MAG: hypothetical protein WC783_02700 [Candidatus Paceibacterota bacterium]|jgi:hypothetical protein